MTVKINEGFQTRYIDGLCVIVGTDKRAFYGMIKLNDTAAFIWNGISEGKDTEEIEDAFAEKYNLTKEKAHADVEKVLIPFKEKNIIDY